MFWLCNFIIIINIDIQEIFFFLNGIETIDFIFF